MDEEKQKEGMSVRELESFAKKHRFEIFFCLAFILACFFSFVMFGPGWAVIAAAIGALVGVLLSGKVHHMHKSILHFVFKQEQTTQIVIGIIALIIAILLPPVFFLILGMHGGKDMIHIVMEISGQHRKD
jgi:membrane associated rhomboid family serine protease